MLSVKQRLLVGLAIGCVSLVLFSVAVYRHFKVSDQSKEDVTDLLRNIEATTGLNTDGIKVVGSAKSPEVIEPLVDSMEASDPIAADKCREAAMEALARIGRPAVPKLIEAIRNAPKTAEAIPFANEAKWPDRFIRRETLKIQARAAMVLGKIGDARALPVLRGLLVDNDPMRVYVKEAVANIDKVNDRVSYPTIDQATSDDAVYEVYSAAIREMFLGEGDNTAGSRTKVWLVVVEDHTTTSRWEFNDESADRARSNAHWTISENPVEKATIEDFRRKNGDSISLEPRFTFPAKQVLISNEELDTLFSGNGDGWRRFHRRYPHSVGCISLSRVGFNPDRDQALLYIARSCGDRCGEGDYVLLRKDAGVWSVKHKDVLWVS